MNRLFTKAISRHHTLSNLLPRNAFKNLSILNSNRTAIQKSYSSDSANRNEENQAENEHENGDTRFGIGGRFTELDKAKFKGLTKTSCSSKTETSKAGRSDDADTFGTLTNEIDDV